MVMIFSRPGYRFQEPGISEMEARVMARFHRRRIEVPRYAPLRRIGCLVPLLEIVDEEYMTLDEIAAMAKERGVPGPDVNEHPEDYGDECYCQTCLSYAD